MYNDLRFVNTVRAAAPFRVGERLVVRQTDRPNVVLTVTNALHPPEGEAGVFEAWVRAAEVPVRRGGRVASCVGRR